MLSFDSFLIKKLSLAIEEGFKISSRNIGIAEPGEKVAILLDESGSMQGQPFNVGKSLMASMLCGLDKSLTFGKKNEFSFRSLNRDFALSL